MVSASAFCTRARAMSCPRPWVIHSWTPLSTRDPASCSAASSRAASSPFRSTFTATVLPLTLRKLDVPESWHPDRAGPPRRRIVRASPRSATRWRTLGAVPARPAARSPSPRGPGPRAVGGRADQVSRRTGGHAWCRSSGRQGPLVSATQPRFRAGRGGRKPRCCKLSGPGRTAGGLLRRSTGGRLSDRLGRRPCSSARCSGTPRFRCSAPRRGTPPASVSSGSSPGSPVLRVSGSCRRHR